MFKVLLSTLLTIIAVSNAATAAQTITMPAATLNDALKFLSWEIRLTQHSTKGALEVSPALARLGFPVLTWPVPRGFMGAGITNLDAESLELTAGQDRLIFKLRFREGGLGNAVAHYRITKAMLECELVPQLGADGVVTFVAMGVRLTAAVKGTHSPVSELYLGRARREFAKLGGTLAKEQLTHYFQLPETQQGIRQLLLWWARNNAAPGAREVDATSVRMTDGVLQFEVLGE